MEATPKATARAMPKRTMRPWEDLGTPTLPSKDKEPMLLLEHKITLMQVLIDNNYANLL